MKLLLISNSGRPYLGHCADFMGSFLGPQVERPVFIAHAAFLDPKTYLAKVQEALAPLEIEPTLLDLHHRPEETLALADAILVGGGNTYRLLQGLQESYMLEPIRERVRHGLPYIGWSAGANITGPTILTTNDWNVVGLTRFDALNLVPFNINPHYQEVDPAMAPHSETRADRIAEYHGVNHNPVLGIEEQTMLHVQDDTVEVIGQGRVLRFEWNRSPQIYADGDTI